MASIFDFLNSIQGWQNPANSAMPYLNKIPGTVQPLYQPYMDAGNNALNQYSGISSSLATPGGATNNYNALAAGFTASPGYQYDVDQTTQAMNQAAAASGMAGTPSAQAALGQQVNNMANQDFNNYMHQTESMQNTGIGGLQDLTHLGFNANSEYAQQLFQMLMAQAGVAYGGQANQNQMNGQDTAYLTKAAMSIPGLSAL